jgi:hypothetical protein
MDCLVEIFEDDVPTETLSNGVECSQLPGDGAIDPEGRAFDALMLAERPNAVDNDVCRAFARCVSALTRGSCGRRPSNADTGSEAGRGLAGPREGVCILNGNPRPEVGAVLDAGMSSIMLRLVCRANKIAKFEYARYKGREILTCVIRIMRCLQSLAQWIYWPSEGGGNGSLVRRGLIV